LRRTEPSAARPRLYGEQALASDMARSTGRQLGELCEGEMLDQLGRAATLLTRARRIHVLGSQAAAGAACQLHHMLARLGDRAVLLGSGTPGATGLDSLRHASADDVLVVLGIEPYGRASLAATRYARERGVSVVALTDSTLSPLARDAQVAMVVAKESPSLFGTLVPLLALAEIVATLVAGRAGARTVEALEPAEAQLVALGELVERRAP
jgi:DNA-binding MurR/RpiR family transcriptional regulator